MEARERILNTIKKKETDRVPVYTLVPFSLENNKFVPGAFHGYTDYDNWRKNDQLYTKIVERMEYECDNFFVWRPASLNAQNIFISPENVEESAIKVHQGIAEKNYYVSVGDKKLTRTEKFTEGTGHSWITEHFCKTIEDAMSLLELEYVNQGSFVDEYMSLKTSLSTKGVIWPTVPSPIMSVCRLFDPQDFLMFCKLEPEKIEMLMEIAFTRTKESLISLLTCGECDIIRFGGAEHATPPLMSPSDFDDLVVKYDKPLMDICKQYGAFVSVHCHGNIKHALKRFSEMGVDQTDPVEIMPFGDVTLSQAREITDSGITLTGCLQFSEMMNESTDYIKNKVKAIIEEAGKKKLILSTTSTPLDNIIPKLYDNYNAMIDAVIEFG